VDSKVAFGSLAVFVALIATGLVVNGVWRNQ
jgi:hypothetical protein